MTYEDLTQDPQPAIARIQSWAGLETDLSAFDTANTARISWRNQHLFAPANAAVLEARAEHITIKPALGWRAAEARAARALAAEICFPFAHRYGYCAEAVS